MLRTRCVKRLTAFAGSVDGNSVMAYIAKERRRRRERERGQKCKACNIWRRREKWRKTLSRRRRGRRGKRRSKGVAKCTDEKTTKERISGRKTGRRRRRRMRKKCVRVWRVRETGGWVKRGGNKKNTRSSLVAGPREWAWRGGEDTRSLPFLTGQVHASISAVADGECFVRSRSEIATFHRTTLLPSLPPSFSRERGRPRPGPFGLLWSLFSTRARLQHLRGAPRRASPWDVAQRLLDDPPKLHNKLNRVAKPISIPESDNFRHENARVRAPTPRSASEEAAISDFKYSRDFPASPAHPGEMTRGIIKPWMSSRVRLARPTEIQRLFGFLQSHSPWATAALLSRQDSVLIELNPAWALFRCYVLFNTIGRQQCEAARMKMSKMCHFWTFLCLKKWYTCYTAFWHA